MEYGTKCTQIEGVPVLGYPERLRRALDNLADSAIKFTPSGGEVKLRLSREAEWAEIAVADSGIGIGKDELGLVFNRFYRGRNAADHPGSGLGLAIVKTIVERHGGRISARSDGRGTVFLVRLPVVVA